MINRKGNRGGGSEFWSGIIGLLSDVFTRCTKLFLYARRCARAGELIWKSRRTSCTFCTAKRACVYILPDPKTHVHVPIRHVLKYTLYTMYKKYRPISITILPKTSMYIMYFLYTTPPILYILYRQKTSPRYLLRAL
jgi:hypothetical protein